jgi:hypothetical protein
MARGPGLRARGAGLRARGAGLRARGSGLRARGETVLLLDNSVKLRGKKENYENQSSKNLRKKGPQA